MPDVSSKKGLAVWVSRNCGYTNGAKLRLNVIKNLTQNGLKINLKHSCLSQQKPVLNYQELYQLLSHHKFYLAFENGYHCKDYITEKLWYNSLYVGTVPIVWGGLKKDYVRIAPSNSFIYYEDFNNTQELIDYLNYLDKNDSAYAEYFAWRKQYPCKFPLYQIHNPNERVYAEDVFYSNFINAYCSLSKMLQQNFNKTSKIIPSLEKFWYHSERRECFH